MLLLVLLNENCRGIGIKFRNTTQNYHVTQHFFPI